jgi:hypothetical protein
MRDNEHQCAPLHRGNHGLLSSSSNTSASNTAPRSPKSLTPASLRCGDVFDVIVLENDSTDNPTQYVERVSTDGVAATLTGLPHYDVFIATHYFIQWAVWSGERFSISHRYL